MLLRWMVLLLLTLSAVSVMGQTEPTADETAGGTPKYVTEETAEERRARVGEVDPGLNPDPETVFHRKGKDWTIQRYPKRLAAYDVRKGYVRPMANINFAYEIYQENDMYVWVWSPTPEEVQRRTQQLRRDKKSKWNREQIEYLEKLRDEFAPLTPPEVDKTIRFENASEGLPTGGSFRHAAALADMNGDGHIDIITPPQRGMRDFRPSIFLGDGTGTKWTRWQAASWPYAMDYGTVVAGDFNGDRRPDLAFGMHLRGVRVLLNNGAGRFVDASEGMMDPFPTRRVATADLDNDGDLDLLAIYEGPSRGQNLKSSSRVRAYINEGKAAKWRVVHATGESDTLGGDWLAVGKFNNDRFPDFAGSSNLLNGNDTLHRSTGPARWESVPSPDYFLVPYYSYYTAVAAGRISSRNLDDVVVSYERHWPRIQADLVEKPAVTQFVGIDRISFAGKEPSRTPVMRFPSPRSIPAVATADFDGDRKNDILFTRYEPREGVLLLGDAKGGFQRAKVDGLELLDNPNYDMTVGDVNGDGRPDVVMLFESNAESSFGTQNGAVRVYLNRGLVR